MHDQIRDYIRAGFAGLYIVTFEDVRAEAELKALADELEYTLFNWTITRGILNTSTGTVENILDPIDAVNAVADLPEKSLLVLSDFHQFLGDRAQPASPLVTRSLKEQIRTCGTGNDSPSGAKAQSVTRAWICGWKWTSSPNVWMAATIPGTASRPSSAVWASSRTVSHAQRASPPSNLRSNRKKIRNLFGMVKTYCRCPTLARTFSRMCMAVSNVRF